MTSAGAKCFSTCKPITGTTECHCPTCHQSFWTIEDFDLHRTDDSVPEDQDNDCWEPDSVGLIKEDGLWSTPENHMQRRIVVARLEKAREARGK